MTNFIVIKKTINDLSDGALLLYSEIIKNDPLHLSLIGWEKSKQPYVDELVQSRLGYINYGNLRVIRISNNYTSVKGVGSTKINIWTSDKPIDARNNGIKKLFASLDGVSISVPYTGTYELKVYANNNITDVEHDRSQEFIATLRYGSIDYFSDSEIGITGVLHDVYSYRFGQSASTAYDDYTSTEPYQCEDTKYCPYGTNHLIGRYQPPKMKNSLAFASMSVYNR